MFGHKINATSTPEEDRSTKENGDSILHAILGEWNGKEYACPAVVEKKKQIKKAIIEAKPNDALYPLIVESIKTHIRIGAEFFDISSFLMSTYRAYKNKKSVLISPGWDKFAQVINKFPSLVEIIEELSQLPTKALLQKKFHDALPRKDALLYRLMTSNLQLNQALEEYHKQLETEFNLK